MSATDAAPGAAKRQLLSATANRPFYFSYCYSFLSHEFILVTVGDFGLIRGFHIFVTWLYVLYMILANRAVGIEVQGLEDQVNR